MAPTSPWQTSWQSPLGWITVRGRTGLVAAGFADGPCDDPRDPLGVIDALARWFAGELHALDALPIAPRGTDHQREVWQAVRTIPPGEVRTYGELASRVGSVARAVGQANGANPLALFVPCHRVVGRGNALTGYAWGVERKRWLLTHEAGGTSLFP